MIKTTNETEKTTNDSIAYFSKKLNKLFDTMEELQTAELKAEDELKKKNALSNEKKQKAKEVEDAYVNFRHVINSTTKEVDEVQKKADKLQREAYNNFINLKNKFVEKYGSFHMTFSSKDDTIKDKTEINDTVYSDLYDFIDKLFKEW